MEIIISMIIVSMLLFTHHIFSLTDQKSPPRRTSGTTFERKLEKYLKLIPNFLSEKSQNDHRILNKATRDLKAGNSVEECIATSYLFETALSINECGYNIQRLVSMLPSVKKFLAIMKNWKDNNLISHSFWSKTSTLIFKTTFINDPDHVMVLSAVLKELNCESKYMKNDIENIDEPHHHEELAQELTSILHTQFEAMDSNSKIKSNDLYSLGYIMGFCDWYMQDWCRKNNINFSQEASAKDILTMAIVFMQIYGQENGSKLYGRVLNAMKNQNIEVAQGQAAGNKDYLRFNNENIAPDGLLTYCS